MRLRHRYMRCFCVYLTISSTSQSRCFIVVWTKTNKKIRWKIWFKKRFNLLQLKWLQTTGFSLLSACCFVYLSSFLFAGISRPFFCFWGKRKFVHYAFGQALSLWLFFFCRRFWSVRISVVWISIFDPAIA